MSSNYSESNFDKKHNFNEQDRNTYQATKHDKYPSLVQLWGRSDHSFNCYGCQIGVLSPFVSRGRVGSVFAREYQIMLLSLESSDTPSLSSC